MKDIDEERLLAELYLNLKGPKRKRDDWISIAWKIRRLSNYYGSPHKAAEKLGVSYELIRSILSITKLPKEVQQLIKDGKILYDAAHRLQRVKGAEKQIEAASAIAGLPSHKQREIIQYARRFPDLSLDNYKRRVTDEAVKREKLHVAIVLLRDDSFQYLQSVSKKEDVPLEKLILNIVQQWIEKRAGSGR